MPLFAHLKQHFIGYLFAAANLFCAVFLQLLEQPWPAHLLYLVFTLSISYCYSSDKTSLKHSSYWLAAVAIISVGLLYPLDVEEIEEVYILVPLLFLMANPGNLWPILISLLLTLAYFPASDGNELGEIIEDAMEIVVITGFASIMTYFQQKTVRQMQTLHHESYSDYLTGLGNRKKFLDICSNFKQQQKVFSILVIDLDGFKKINDQLGHFLGDQAIKLVGQRLAALASATQQVYRIGGDEFAFIVCDVEDLALQSQRLAQQIISLSDHPYRLNNKHYNIQTSIGISLFPIDAADIEMLCSNADMAMYQAKNHGRNTYVFYSAKLSERTRRHHELENDLQKAVQLGQLSLHYQPKVDLRSGKILSAEALLRWQHPRYGFISPMEFIPIAEESLSILSIGRWVIETACQDMARWKTDYPLHSIAINASPIQLRDRGFSNFIAECLARYNCHASWFEIEQTESAMMDNPKDNIRALTSLKEMGLSLALDDFGTAYSSLSHLSLLPLDVLKIDKRFVDNCCTNSRDHMIVRTIIQLARNLGMKTVAEGVESAEQLALLQQEGCEMYQGYYFSKPITAAEFEQLLQQQGTH